MEERVRAHKLSLLAADNSKTISQAATSSMTVQEQPQLTTLVGQNSQVHGVSATANKSDVAQHISSEQLSRKVICQTEKSAMEASRKVDNMLANTEPLVIENPVTDRKMIKPKKKYKKKKKTDKPVSPA